MPVILVWYPKHGHVGHMSLRVSSNLYISFWPKEECGPLTGTVPSQASSYDEDCLDEGHTDSNGRQIPRPPDETIDVNIDLNISDVRSWWNDYQHSGYNLLMKNCCDAVDAAIGQGISTWNLVDQAKYFAIQQRIRSIKQVLAAGCVTQKKKSRS